MRNQFSQENLTNKTLSQILRGLHSLCKPMDMRWKDFQSWQCAFSLLFKNNYFFFNRRIIALQNFAVFCQTSTWISHRYTYIPSLLKLSPTSLPSPSPFTPLDWYRASVWVSWAIQQIAIAIYFIYGNVSFHITLSIHLNLSSLLPLSISRFSMFVSPLLPCK